MARCNIVSKYPCALLNRIGSFFFASQAFFTLKADKVKVFAFEINELAFSENFLKEDSTKYSFIPQKEGRILLKWVFLDR